MIPNALFPSPPVFIEAVVGSSFGGGISVFKVVKCDAGLARVVLGRSVLRTSVSLPYVIIFACSLNHFVVPEIPMYANMNAIVGLTRYDSDDDDEDVNRCDTYVTCFEPQVRSGP